MSRFYKREDLSDKTVSDNMKITIYVIFFALLALCIVLIGRLMYLNTVDGDKYAKAVLSKQAYSTRNLVSERGNIYDRNGRALTKNVKIYDLIIEPAVILTSDKDGKKHIYYEPSIDAICDVFGYDKAELKILIDKNKDSYRVVLAKNIGYEAVQAYRDYKSASKKHNLITGVNFEESYIRVYPYDSLASHVLGFTKSDGSGSYGLEQYYNEELTGTDGLSYGYYDAELNRKKVIQNPISGKDLYTTLDYNMQNVIEKKIAEFRETVGCKNIGIILMNPNDGGIYGMASNQEYNLNDPRNLSAFYSEEELKNMSEEAKLAAIYAIWRNFCVSDTYEPGSTFKTITVASALEEDTVGTNATFNCTGNREVGGWTINCNKKYGHGEITLTQALMKSCNCALMDIAEKLGPDAFFKYQRMFGFGQKTGIDIVGESSGIVIDRKNLNATELATSSFGTTFNVTMIQMASAYASIINGGTYYRPHIVSEIKDESGATVTSYKAQAVKETVSKNTSEFIKKALYMTVEGGTATPAKVEGYIIGGKTGTAQKRPRDEKKYVVSFVGFAPVDDPQIMMYIVMDEIYSEELKSSSSSATKMCAAIFKEILPYIGIYPEGDIEYPVDWELAGISENLVVDETDEINSDSIPEEYQED